MAVRYLYNNETCNVPKNPEATAKISCVKILGKMYNPL